MSSLVNRIHFRVGIGQMQIKIIATMIRMVFLVLLGTTALMVRPKPFLVPPVITVPMPRPPTMLAQGYSFPLCFFSCVN